MKTIANALFVISVSLAAILFVVCAMIQSSAHADDAPKVAAVSEFFPLVAQHQSDGSWVVPMPDGSSPPLLQFWPKGVEAADAKDEKIARLKAENLRLIKTIGEANDYIQHLPNIIGSKQYFHP